MTLFGRTTGERGPHRGKPGGTRLRRPSRDFRSEHKQIVRDAEWMRLMAGRIPALSLEERRVLVRDALERLRRIGLHAIAEERVFYPVLSRLLGTRNVGNAMTVDHRFIHARMQYLAETDPASTAALQAILYGLHAVITTHVQKEDEILAPLVEQVREANG
jgi:iron-sulfur cluster repair protein YtfE (RIC family)